MNTEALTATRITSQTARASRPRASSLLVNASTYAPAQRINLRLVPGFLFTGPAHGVDPDAKAWPTRRQGGVKRGSP